MVRYTEKGTRQCWSCENRTAKDYGLNLYGGKMVAFPYCEITGMYMYEIYNTPCKHYERRVSK